MERKGKTIIVTGAARGVGCKTAQMQAAKGSRLALAGIDDQSPGQAQGENSPGAPGGA